MFKVVADQLKIAQGWVRCGHCAEVFDASAQLQAGDAGTPPAPMLQDDRPPEHADSGQAAAGLEQSMAQPSDLPDPAPTPEEAPVAPEPEPALESDPEPADLEHDDREGDFDPAAWKQALLQGEQQFVAPLISESAPDLPHALDQPLQATAIASEFSAPGESDADAAATPDADEEAAQPEQEVSFVRDARRRAFWKRPLVRAVLGSLLLLLGALLVLQWMVQHRDRLAALDPRWTPVLQALCGTFQCEIRPPRHIESLLIDSSTFTKTGTDTYRLSFALKNSGDTMLEMPSLELTLTDTQDQAVVRRVLSPRQFGVNAATLAAHSELAGVVSLKVSDDTERAGPPSSSSPATPRSPLRVAGYRILAFYP